MPNGLGLIEGLCAFINKAKNDYCISEIGVAAENGQVFGTADSLNESPMWLSPPIVLTTQENQFLTNSSVLIDLITNSFASTDSLFHLSESLKQILRLIRFNGTADGGGTCSSHIDFFNIIDEALWSLQDVNYFYSHFLPLVSYADSLKQLYNSTHHDSVISHYQTYFSTLYIVHIQIN